MPLLRSLGRRRLAAAVLAVAPFVGLAPLPGGTAPWPPGVSHDGFSEAMGYRPVAATGRPDVLLRPDGGCSTPTGGTRFAFDDACREHDLAYDLLRYRASHDESIDPQARWVADARFGLRMVERCAERGPGDAPGCLATAGLYAAVVALNSARQLYGPPVQESVLEIAVSTVVLLVVLALLMAQTAAFAFRTMLRREDLGLRRPPPGSGWSGSDGSPVAWADLGREGRRLLTRPAPVPGALRIFVGLDCARGLDGRVRLAIAEADRVGAFTRGTVCVAVPTGSGWVNPVAVEALERATDGDVATITVQYDAAPSWLSVVARPGAHRRAAEELLRAVHERRNALDTDARPRLVVFGESLGANGLATAIRRLPHVTAGLDGGLLVGGIGSAAWDAPRGVDLLRHDDDPVAQLRVRSLPRPTRGQHASQMRSPRGHRWERLVTASRVLRTMPGAGRTPEGTGHHYGRELDAAWRMNLTRRAPVAATA